MRDFLKKMVDNEVNRIDKQLSLHRRNAKAYQRENSIVRVVVVSCLKQLGPVRSTSLLIISMFPSLV